jgi:hypothetical protein
MNTKTNWHIAQRGITRAACILILGALVALTMASHPPPTQAGELLAADTMLNPDGTLNLRAGTSGAIDLRGWNVTLDAVRGPVFAPAGQPQNKPTALVWSTLGSGVGSTVRALAVSGTDMYVGGLFTTCGGTSGCNYVAKWNGSSWSTLGSGVGSTVRAFAVSGTDLYVGGDFTTCGGTSGCNYVAKWNGSSWSTLGTGLNNSVQALAVSGTDLFVGGSFTTCGGTPNCNNIAKWNGSNWSTLGSGVGVGSTVIALAVSGTDLYVGGDFTTCGGTSGCNRIAKWDGSNWSTLGTGMGNTVIALAVSGTDLYVGGSFTTCGSTSGCNRVAKYGSGIGTCTSQATGNWNTIATWNCGTVPATGDSVVIANTHTVTLDVNTADLKDFTINSGGTLTNDGNARTVSLTGNWSNSGTFTPGTFIGVTFDGTGAQMLTGNTTFYNLNVNSGSTLDVGSSVVAVNGTATNVGTIKRLAPAQAIALSADYTFNDGIGQPTAIINQTGGTAMGNTTVQVNAHTTTAHACSATTLGGAPVTRYYDITPTNGANVTADITLYYFDGASNSEANGNTLANIAIYHCEGGIWVRLSGGTYSTGTSGNYKWVKLAGHSYTAFSPFAIGGGPGAPTAVTLSQFSAQPGFDLVAWFRQILGH